MRTQNNLVKITIICWVVVFTPLHKTAAYENTAIPPLAFVEVMPNPDGTDTKTNEYFKLKNNSAENQKIDGYRACNVSGECYVLKGELAAADCLKIFRTDFTFTLHNDKEELNLYDSKGNLLSQIITGTAPSGKTWQCFQSRCDWGAPKDDCDYSSLAPKEEPEFEEETLPPKDTSQTENSNLNKNSNDNSFEKETEDLQTVKIDEPESNINNNSAPEKPDNPSLDLTDPKDLKQISKKMKKDKLISIVVNIRGIIAVPQGLTGKTIFYFLFEGPTSSQNILIKTRVYSSCQNSPYCLRDLELKQGDKLSIKRASLKRIESRWELSLDKNTQIETFEKQKLKKAGMPKKTEKRNTNGFFEKQEGKIIAIKGEVVSKKGDYFFILDHKLQKIVSVFVSKPLRNAFSQKLDPVPLGYFPFYLESQSNKFWIGGLLETKGVVEKSDKEYRVLATEINKMLPNNSDNKLSKLEENRTKKDEKEIRESAISNKNEVEAKQLKKEIEDGNNNNVNSSISQTAAETVEKADKSKLFRGDGKVKLKQLLARSLSWKNIFGIAFNKIIGHMYSLEQYF